MLARSIHFPLNHLTLGFLRRSSALTLAIKLILSPRRSTSDADSFKSCHLFCSHLKGVNTGLHCIYYDVTGDPGIVYEMVLIFFFFFLMNREGFSILQLVFLEQNMSYGLIGRNKFCLVLYYMK